MIEGQELSALFSRLTFRTAGLPHFDSLRLPYRCVAADIVKAEPLVFESGDLATAMRASMAIPSVFSPVRLDSMTLLVDGGVFRNFPVQEAIDLGADYIIGVYVGFPDKVSADELDDLASILARTTLLFGTKDVQKQRQMVDLLIVPDMNGLSTGSFGKGLEIEARGEEAARKVFPRLQHVADSIDNIGLPYEHKETESNDSVWVTDISIGKLTHTSRDFLLKKTGLKPGMWVTPDILDEAIDLAFGTLYYDKINYEFQRMGEDMQLKLNVMERPDTYLKASLHYDNYFGPGVILGFSRHNLLIKGTKMNVIGDLSEYPQLRINYNKYFGKRHNLYASIHYLFERSKLPVYDDKKELGLTRDNYMTTGFSMNYVVRTNNRIGAGIQYRITNIHPEEGLRNTSDLFNFDRLGFHATDTRVQYEHNTLDDNLYPTRGTNAFAQVKYILTGTEYIRDWVIDTLEIGDTRLEVEPFWNIRMRAEHYVPVSGRMSLITGADMGFSSAESMLTDVFMIGGYRYNLRRKNVPFLGYGIDQYGAYNFFTLKAGLQYEVGSGLYLGLAANGLLVSDQYKDLFIAAFSPANEQRQLGLGGGITYDSPIGPLSVWLASTTDELAPKWYINFGFTF